MSQPVEKLPSCSFLLRLLPASSAYDSPCLPPPNDYVQTAHKASYARLFTYFQTNDVTHLHELQKCVVKYMPRQDWSAMQTLAESAYKKAIEDAITVSRR